VILLQTFMDTFNDGEPMIVRLKNVCDCYMILKFEVFPVISLKIMSHTRGSNMTIIRGFRLGPGFIHFYYNHMEQFL
jgi:hypothetical protein